MSEKRVSAEVDYDDQHGPIVRAYVGNTKVAVYLGDQTGVVTYPDGQHGIEVTGPWHKMPGLLAADEIEQLRKQRTDLGNLNSELMDQVERLGTALETIAAGYDGKHSADDYGEIARQALQTKVSPTYFGVDLAVPGSDRTVHTCPYCKAIINDIRAPHKCETEKDTT